MFQKELQRLNSILLLEEEKVLEVVKVLKKPGKQY